MDLHTVGVDVLYIWSWAKITDFWPIPLPVNSYVAYCRTYCVLVMAVPCKTLTTVGLEPTPFQTRGLIDSFCKEALI